MFYDVFQIPKTCYKIWYLQNIKCTINIYVFLTYKCIQYNSNIQFHVLSQIIKISHLFNYFDVRRQTNTKSI